MHARRRRTTGATTIRRAELVSCFTPRAQHACVLHAGTTAWVRAGWRWRRRAQAVQVRVIPTRTWIMCKLFPRYVFFAQPSFFQGNTSFLGLVAVDMAAFGTECDDKRWWLAPRSSAPAMVVCVVFLSPLVCAA